MKKFVLRVVILGGVIFGVAYLLPSLIEVSSFQAALLAALTLALVNAFIRPVVLIFTIPITIMTLGLFALVINALMLYIVDYVVEGFMVAGFFQAIAAALIISMTSAFLTKRVVD